MTQKYAFCLCLQKESSCSMLAVLWECPTQPLPSLTPDISGDLWNSVSASLTQWIYFGRWIERGEIRSLTLNSTFVLGSARPADKWMSLSKAQFLLFKGMEGSLGNLTPTIVLMATIPLAQVRFAARPHRMDPVKLLVGDSIWQTPGTHRKGIQGWRPRC